mmetsp:Transcript_21650/g.62130  ORF Transcript_21650/g.62130 Transcript_21650/m.62130 type:complete len:463 (-) Transcript_21650:134-1522(-)
MLRETDFQARLEAALALRRERESREERSGTGHLKAGKGGGKSGGKGGKSKNKKKGKGKDQTKSIGGGENMQGDNESAVDDEVEEEGTNDDSKMSTSDNEDQQDTTPTDPTGGEDPTPAIDPCQSLFDNTLHPTPEASLAHMSAKYGFFLPDMEYCVDLESLLGYCQEKVKLGHHCLYCQRIFQTWSGCQKHMIDAEHCKLRYERGVDQEEFDVFYDFTEANAEFLGRGRRQQEEDGEVVYADDMDEDGDEGEDGEWEDISDDEMDDDVDNNEDDDAEDDYQRYEAELKTHGFDITPLGELVFPDGRIIGHRGLSRYYKQRFAPDGERAAVTAARRAAGERVYAGRVHQMGGAAAPAGDASDSRETTLALAKAGLVAGAAAGRSGRGILVPAAGTSGPSGGGGAGVGSFTALSLYRYKAVVKKSRREEAKGFRLQQRSKMNTNRMDKKANRLMNGVSVAHAMR